MINNICKKCNTEKNNKGKCTVCIKIYQKKWAKDNQIHLINKRKELHIINRDINIKRAQDWYIVNKIYKKEYDKEYYLINKEKKQQKAHQWYLNNKEKIKLNHKISEANKYKNDLNFRIKNRISNSINKALKKCGTHKNGYKTIDYLPYSIEELQLHLFSQFEPWMTWENWGKYIAKTWDDNDPTTWTWQIDHIIPQCHLSYSSMEDDNFKKCWALENLRPLSAKSNVRRSRKV